MVDLVGQTLGQYEILEEIAKGGMATVFKARQKSIGRDVAIKVLPANFTHDETFIERFYREVEVIAQLQHPHILPVYDFGKHENMPYIVMAYINGGTLTDRITEGPMPMAEVARMAAQIADALEFAHSKGIVHRDFKPSNVLLDARGNTYLADFGLAKLTESSSNITGTMIIGTPDYMAPEQARGGEITPTVDIYAVGVTVYQMLTGEAPYEAPTAAGVLVAHITEPIPNILDARPDLPDAVQDVIESALAKDAQDRYQSVDMLRKNLAKALSGQALERRSEDSSQERMDALLMTNMLGHAIFVDSNCLHLLRRHQNEARHIIGKPLAQVLGCGDAVAARLIKDISVNETVKDQQIEITDSRGKQHTVSFSATATRDDDGKFVGADIKLSTIPTISEAPSDTFNSMPGVMDTQQETYLQSYFKAQIEALYEMLVQWAGKRVAENLEDILNETGQRNAWPVNMEKGQITVQLKRTDSAVYQALLARAMSYAASIIGVNQVVKEMEYVNKNTESSILKFVQTLELDQLYKDILD